MAFNHSPDVVPVYIALLIFGVLVALIVVVINVVIFCRIFSKAGFSWTLGLLMLVPIANIIMPFFLAFADWPVQKEVRQLRQQQGKPEA
jgi:UPF0716 family protein affecting phage T7 exclusion